MTLYRVVTIIITILGLLSLGAIALILVALWALLQPVDTGQQLGALAIAGFLRGAP